MLKRLRVLVPKTSNQNQSELGQAQIPVAQWSADQEKNLALLASWSVDQKPTAKRGNFSIEKLLSITKKGSKSSLSVLKKS